MNIMPKDQGNIPRTPQKIEPMQDNKTATGAIWGVVFFVVTILWIIIGVTFTQCSQ